jgi:hypothetical protein
LGVLNPLAPTIPTAVGAGTGNCDTCRASAIP